MFGSTLGKGVAITLAIIGVVQLAAKMTVQTDIEKGAKVYQKQYFEHQELQKAEGKKMVEAHEAKMKRRFLLDDIGRSLFSIKRTVEQHNNRHGEWPADMTALGLESKKAADGKYTESIKIDDGEIYAFLTPEYGENKIIRLFYSGAYLNKWSCTTNLQLPEGNEIAGMKCTEDSGISFSGTYFQ